MQGFREEHTTILQGNFLADAIGNAAERVENITTRVLGLEAGGEGKKLKLLLVHAIDSNDDGCEFDHFFSVAPPDLVQLGQIFRVPAIPLFHSPHFRKVSTHF